MLKRTPFKSKTSSLKKNGSLRAKPKSQEEKDQDKEDSEKMWDFFHLCWQKEMEKTGDILRCYETGVSLAGYYNNSCIYHHILFKEKYPEYKYEEWNICFLHPDIHTLVHQNIDLCPRVKELTKLLHTKFS